MIYFDIFYAEAEARTSQEKMLYTTIKKTQKSIRIEVAIEVKKKIGYQK